MLSVMYALSISLLTNEDFNMKTILILVAIDLYLLGYAILFC